MIVLALLGGCATDGKNKVPAAHEASRRPGSSVTTLGDGRVGFVITEAPTMDSESRADFGRAVAMLQEQRYAQAIERLEKIIGQSPGVTAPYIDIAMAYRAIGQPEQAEAYLETALKLFPGHPVACNEYGLLYRSTGRFAEARGMYEAAIAKFPYYYPAHKNLGILCDVYLKDQACALKHYEVYAEAKPDDDKVRIWIADLRARLGRP